MAKFIKPIYKVYSIKENYLESPEAIYEGSILRITLQEESEHETDFEAKEKIHELCRYSEDSEFTYLKVYKSIK